MANAISTIPENAVVAVGSDSSSAYNIALLSNRTVVLMRDQTVSHLLGQRKLAEALHTYGVTHAIGYDESIEGLIMVQPAPINSVPLSGFTSWLIHFIR